jgi:hypothetical protein
MVEEPAQGLAGKDDADERGGDNPKSDRRERGDLEKPLPAVQEPLEKKVEEIRDRPEETSPTRSDR